MELKVPGIDKLMDYAASGIGAIAGPMLSPWKARQEAKVKLIQAKAEADARIVHAGAEAVTMKIIADAQAQARQHLLADEEQLHGSARIDSSAITQKIEFQERKRLSNATVVISHSAAELDGKDVDNHDPDPDWTARYFDCIQDVSSSDMQRLWAKLLSGEVKRPGSTSLRTMDTLKNMTGTEAELFNSVCNYVLETELFSVFNEDDYIAEFPEMRHVNMVRCQDCRLLELGQSSYNITKNNPNFVYNRYLLRVSGMAEKKISFRIATLTTAGAELYRISDPRTNDKYMRALATYLQKIECQLSCAEILARCSDGSVRHGAFAPVL